MPDETALSYKENHGDFTDAKDANNTELWATNNKQISATTVTNLNAYDLKNTYK